MTDRERATVLRLAEERGVTKESRAHAQLEAWLRERPVDALFDAAIEASHGDDRVDVQDHSRSVS